MKLHENKVLFTQAIEATVNELGIYPEFVEKDYWICHILQNLSRLDKANLCVWKGGTSLAKAYRLINRFSSDVDFAILTDILSQNQQKKLVAKIGHESTAGLTELYKQDTVKNNRFRKTYHSYDSVLNRTNTNLEFLGTHVIVEINTYGNPYPFERRSVISFIADMMHKRGLEDIAAEYDMDPFELNVLDKRRTMIEKIVSLLRFSFTSPDYSGLKEKIRHFYDLHFMFQDLDCQKYLNNGFANALIELVAHDKSEYDRPPQWKESDILSSILFSDFDEIWGKLTSVYKNVLGALCYGNIPAAEEVADSNKRILLHVKSILSS